MKRITLIVGAVLIFAVGVLVGASTHRYELHIWNRGGTVSPRLNAMYVLDTWTGEVTKK